MTNKKFSILFVCIANSCRSQMAEALFNELISNYDVDAFATSAGTLPAKEVNPSALEVLTELNIKHNSYPTTLTLEMMKTADVIVSMGCMSSDFCPATFIPKTQDWEIDDPQNQSISKFREVRDVIREKVENLLLDLSKSNE